MQVWVPGAEGQLGRALVSRLRSSASVDGVIGTTHAELDICNDMAVRRFFDQNKFSYVFNAAAYTAVDRAEEEPALAHALNSEAVGRLARLSKAYARTLVHVSTDYVFDGEAAGVPYTEHSPVRPLGVYGQSKYAGERAILDAYGVCRFDDLSTADAVPAYIVRTSWLFSKGGPSFVHTMMRLMREGVVPKVVADQTGRPTYAPDLAAALVDLAGLGLSEAAAAGLYHVANAEETTWWGLACAVHQRLMESGDIEATLPKPVPLITAEYPTSAPRPQYTVLNTKKAETCLGYILPPWRKALVDML